MYRSAFLTSALVGGEWSASRPCRVTLFPRKRAPWYSLDRRLSGSQSQSGRYGESLLGLELRPHSRQALASRYTECATAALE
jgi:hypothetical protein